MITISLYHVYHVGQLQIYHIKCSGVNSVKCHNIVGPGVDTAKFQQLAPGLEMLPGHMSVFHTAGYIEIE